MRNTHGSWGSKGMQEGASNSFTILDFHLSCPLGELHSRGVTLATINTGNNHFVKLSGMDNGLEDGMDYGLWNGTVGSKIFAVWLPPLN